MSTRIGVPSARFQVRVGRIFAGSPFVLMLGSLPFDEVQGASAVFERERNLAGPGQNADRTVDPEVAGMRSELLRVKDELEGSAREIDELRTKLARATEDRENPP